MGTVVEEAIVSVSNHLFVHVFAYAPDETAMSNLDAIIATLRSEPSSH